MISFQKTDEQELLLESLRSLVKEYGSEGYIKECEDRHEYPEALHRALVDSGLLLLGVPEEYGGIPSDTLTLMMFHEEFARTCSGAYAIESAVLPITDMQKFGSAKQLEQCVEAIQNCKHPFCLGFSEPEAGSDSGAVTTTFRRENGRVFISGHKTFITRADRAAHMLCLTRDFDAPPDRAYTTWWVPMNAPGIKMRPIPKFGWHMLGSYEVYLDNVEIGEEDVVGNIGKGFQNLMKNFEIERLIMSATALGEAEMAFEDALGYAKQRVQFGKAIGSFQLIQERLVDMYTKIENMKNLVYKAAWLEDQKKPVNTYAAICKHYCADASFDVINSAMQIMGGIGYSEDVRIGRLLRNNRICGIGGGTQEIMIHVAGRALQKEYRFV
jgi:alkylation response protein AidB-like acyl-CoA dehydrogenase